MKIEPYKVVYARLKAKRDAIRASQKNPRPARTPFAYSISKKARPKPKEKQ